MTEIGQEEICSVYGVDKRKCQVKVADATGVILVTLWENLIKEIEQGKSYTFTSLNSMNLENFQSLPQNLLPEWPQTQK